MNIIYPPLVEDSLSYYFYDKEIDLQDKVDMYQSMLSAGVIDEYGLPTKEALEKGWVKDFYEEENLSFEEFLNLYPIFCSYDKNKFQLIDGFWEISHSFKEQLIKEIKSEKMGYDAILQITEYLSER
ncbi:hypothetical protein [Vagococcus luciliae]|uniref:Uncharacterized protein n=1 Tax=Vagococcus luciliae TaxID=2920380 RepID=A0ABY5NWV9_9ENTE|nr:hypothetical protein [Vagococcus luciliae]UUV98131.1 hypothetical protein G314FT_02220 [Vagococcus luciliae]